MLGKRWLHITASSPMNVVVSIRGKSYDYSAAENDIKKFKQILRFNQGAALAYLKKKAFTACKFVDGTWVPQEYLEQIEKFKKVYFRLTETMTETELDG